MGSSYSNPKPQLWQRTESKALTVTCGGISKSDSLVSEAGVNLWRCFKGRVHGNLWHISVVDVFVAVPNTID